MGGVRRLAFRRTTTRSNSHELLRAHDSVGVVLLFRVDALVADDGKAAVKVYVVFGQTGEYSDHSSWPVRGFLTREKAEDFDFMATKWARGWMERHENNRYRQEARDDRPAHDPGFRSDYTGTDYYTIEVEVES